MPRPLEKLVFFKKYNYILDGAQHLWDQNIALSEVVLFSFLVFSFLSHICSQFLELIFHTSEENTTGLVSCPLGNILMQVRHYPSTAEQLAHAFLTHWLRHLAKNLILATSSLISPQSRHRSPTGKAFSPGH